VSLRSRLAGDLGTVAAEALVRAAEAANRERARGLDLGR
jgi:hypothetical protein